MALAHDEALELVQSSKRKTTKQKIKISESQIKQARLETLNIHLSQPIQQYIVQLVLATRNPDGYAKELKSWIDYGASPRGSIGLERVSRAHAWINGRDFVSPDDVQKMAHDALRHRIILSFEAEAEGVDTDHVITRAARSCSCSLTIDFLILYSIFFVSLKWI